MKLDEESAWNELCRFADAAGVELDERADPTFEGEIKDTDSEVSDYSVLMKAIRRGDMVVDDQGALELQLTRPAGNGASKVRMDPARYHYGKAMLAFSGGTRGRNADDKLGKMLTFLETLAELPRGTLADVPGRLDVNRVIALAVLMLSE